MKIYATHKMSGMISKSLEQPADAQPYFDTTEFQDILSDMIFRALDGEDILKECEGHDFLTDLMVGVVEHAQGDESPEVKACVAKKIPILMDEGYEQKAAIAISFKMCKENPSVAEKAKEVPKQGKMTDEELRQMGRDRLASIDGTKIPSISNTREVNLSVTEDQGLAATFLPSYTRSIASPGREVREIEKADQISKDGTSEGAKLGWETRQRGSSPEEPAAPAKYVDPLSDPNATISQLKAAAVATRGRIRELKQWKLTPDQKFKISLSEKRLNAIMARIGEKRGAEKSQEGDTGSPFASTSPVDKAGTPEGAERGWETRRGAAPVEEEEEKKPKQKPSIMADALRDALRGMMGTTSSPAPAPKPAADDDPLGIESGDIPPPPDDLPPPTSQPPSAPKPKESDAERAAAWARQVLAGSSSSRWRGQPGGWGPKEQEAKKQEAKEEGDAVKVLIQMGHSKAEATKAVERAKASLGSGASASDLAREGLKSDYTPADRQRWSAEGKKLSRQALSADVALTRARTTLENALAAGKRVGDETMARLKAEVDQLERNYRSIKAAQSAHTKKEPMSSQERSRREQEAREKRDRDIAWAAVAEREGTRKTTMAGRVARLLEKAFCVVNRT